jgi:acyl dehydratase
VKRYYLDELTVGQVFTSASVALTVEDIKDFAGRYDPQPFHLDEAAADESFFNGLAASGWHTAALTMRLLVEGGAPIQGGMIGAGVELNWPRPTRPGDILTVVSEVVEIRPSKSKPQQGIVVVRSETRNQHGEAVQVMTSKLVAPRSPAAVELARR